MIEYNGSKCTPHGQTRCAICLALAAKGTKPTQAQAAPPPSITGGPPADFEGLSVRDREPKTLEEANTDYDKIVAELNATKEANGLLGAPGITQTLKPAGKVEQDQFARDSFATLPTDDSHASKVLRAAAEFAGAAQAWAQELAYVEKVKKILLLAEAQLIRATGEKVTAETNLRQLVAGE